MVGMTDTTARVERRGGIPYFVVGLQTGGGAFAGGALAWMYFVAGPEPFMGGLPAVAVGGALGATIGASIGIPLLRYLEGRPVGGTLLAALGAVLAVLGVGWAAIYALLGPLVFLSVEGVRNPDGTYTFTESSWDLPVALALLALGAAILVVRWHKARAASIGA
jgi:hypothetical protein